jgi:hypothetical protein
MQALAPKCTQRGANKAQSHLQMQAYKDIQMGEIAPNSTLQIDLELLVRGVGGKYLSRFA